MTTFTEFLDSALDGSTGSDRRIRVAKTLEVNFASSTVRLWGGVGSMITPDGEAWLGFYFEGEDGELQSLIDVPALDDIRQGTSAPVPIRLGYLSAEDYAALRDDETETDGRPITVGYVYLPEDSTRALCQPGNASRLKMVGKPSFKEQRRKTEDGSYKVLYSLTVKAVNLNTGRSRVGANVFTYTGHKFRSEIIHGVEDDEYAQFVARYAGGITLKL